METYSAEVAKLLQVSGTEPCISKWDARRLAQARRTPAGMALGKAVDDLGVKSGIAQSLPRAITSSALLTSTDHTLYLLADRQSVFGLLKIGYKKLFIRDVCGVLKEITPLCVLDVFISETHQRSGHGKTLFEHMLAECDVRPQHLAYDRPSPKLIAFLSKHYNLRDYAPQNNNYVVFDEYFTKTAPKEKEQKGEQSSLREARSSAVADHSRLPQRHSSPHRPSGTSYNIITQQHQCDTPSEAPSTTGRTGKRLVRPIWAA